MRSIPDYDWAWTMRIQDGEALLLEICRMLYYVIGPAGGTCLVQVWLRTEVPRTPSSPDRGSNSWPPDHDSTVHVTEAPALTTRPSASWPSKASIAAQKFATSCKGSDATWELRMGHQWLRADQRCGTFLYAFQINPMRFRSKRNCMSVCDLWPVSALLSTRADQVTPHAWDTAGLLLRSMRKQAPMTS